MEYIRRGWLGAALSMSPVTEPPVANPPLAT